MSVIKKLLIGFAFILSFSLLFIQVAHKDIDFSKMPIVIPIVLSVIIVIRYRVVTRLSSNWGTSLLFNLLIYYLVASFVLLLFIPVPVMMFILLTFPVASVALYISLIKIFTTLSCSNEQRTSKKTTTAHCLVLTLGFAMLVKFLCDSLMDVSIHYLFLGVFFVASYIILEKIKVFERWTVGYEFTFLLLSIIVLFITPFGEHFIEVVAEQLQFSKLHLKYYLLACSKFLLVTSILVVFLTLKPEEKS